MVKSLYNHLPRWLTGLRKNEDGAVAVEFSLLFPVYFGFLVLIMEAGRAIFTFGVVNFAAAEATRFAVVNPDGGEDAIEAIASDSLVGLDPANLTAIVVTNPVDNETQTQLISVEIEYRYVPILPVGFLGSEDGSIALTGASRGFLARAPGTT